MPLPNCWPAATMRCWPVTSTGPWCRTPSLRRRLAEQTRRGRAFPVLYGSALTGAGTDSLAEALTDLLPTDAGDAEGPLSGTVFKIERGAGWAEAGVRASVLRHRPDPGPARFGSGHEGKVTDIRVFDDGTDQQRTSVTAGQIAKLSGLVSVQVGDSLGPTARRADPAFAPPTLETVVTSEDPAQHGALHAALTLLAEQDPLIDLRQDPATGRVFVSSTARFRRRWSRPPWPMTSEFGHVSPRARSSASNGRSASGTRSSNRTPPNPYLATVGLRIEPAAVDSGVSYTVAGERRGTMPPAFFTAIAETVPEALQQGRFGWQVTDCLVTLTHTGYWPRQSHAHAVFDKSMSSTAGDFRQLTRVVLRQAVRGGRDHGARAGVPVPDRGARRVAGPDAPRTRPVRSDPALSGGAG